jgi:hypothetical protein
MKSMFTVYSQPETNCFLTRVRTNIHEGHQDFPITAHSWFLGLYPKGQYDPDNEDKGLFMNVILLMVCGSFSVLPNTHAFVGIQVYFHIASFCQDHGCRRCRELGAHHQYDSA